MCLNQTDVGIDQKDSSGGQVCYDNHACQLMGEVGQASLPVYIAFPQPNGLKAYMQGNSAT